MAQNYSGRLLTQVEIEDQIVAVSEELERQTHEYRDQSEAAAQAEADFKYERARLYLSVVARHPSATVAEKEARVDNAIHDKRQEYLIADARRQATREMLLSLRTRLEALRTLSASVRFQT